MLLAERCHLIGGAVGSSLAWSVADSARRTTPGVRLSPTEMRAFVRGVRRGTEAGPTAAGIEALLRGPDAPVHPDVAGLLALTLGASRARWPSPHPEWARQQGQA
jgi:hypothetical protein